MYNGKISIIHGSCLIPLPQPSPCNGTACRGVALALPFLLPSNKSGNTLSSWKVRHLVRPVSPRDFR